MKKFTLIFCLSFFGFSCEKDSHEEHNHSEVCQMCTDTDGDGEIDCTCDCHCSAP